MVKNKLEHEALERAEKRKNEAQEELVQDDGEQDAKTSKIFLKREKITVNFNASCR